MVMTQTECVCVCVMISSRSWASILPDGSTCNLIDGSKFFLLMTEAVGCSETYASVHQSTWRHIQD